MTIQSGKLARLWLGSDVAASGMRVGAQGMRNVLSSRSSQQINSRKSAMTSPMRAKNDPAAVEAAFSVMRAKREAYERARPAIEAEGKAALGRLWTIAQGDSGQCRHVAGFLLGLYHGGRFRFDLTDLRCVDSEIFDDCIAVLKMDSRPKQEVHMYFENGGAKFEALAKRWSIQDYLNSPCAV